MSYLGSVHSIILPDGNDFSTINLMFCNATSIFKAGNTIFIQTDLPLEYVDGARRDYENLLYVMTVANLASSVSEIVVPDYSDPTGDSVNINTPSGSGYVGVNAFGDHATYKAYEGDTIVFRWNDSWGTFQIRGVWPKYSQIDYNDLINTPAIPAAQVNSDWNSNIGVSKILNKPNFVAGSNMEIVYDQIGESSGTFTFNATDTNTHRPIQVNGTQVLGNNTTALNLKAGSNMSITNSSGTVTFAATDTKPGTITYQEEGTVVGLPTSSSWSTLATLNLTTAGTYLINWCVNFNSQTGATYTTSSGTVYSYRGAGLGATINAEPSALWRQECTCASGVFTTLSGFVAVEVPSGGRTLYLNARQNSSVALNAVHPRLAYIKIK